MRRHCFDVVDDIVRATRVNVLAAEINFWQTFALFGSPRVPEFAAEDVKQNFVAEEGAADTERHNDVNIVADAFREVVQSLNRRGAVEIELAVFFSDVRQFGEVDFFGCAVFAEVRFYETGLAHNFHCRVSFFEVFGVEIEIGLSNFTFTK